MALGSGGSGKEGLAQWPCACLGHQARWPLLGSTQWQDLETATGPTGGRNPRIRTAADLEAHLLSDWTASCRPMARPSSQAPLSSCEQGGQPVALMVAPELTYVGWHGVHLVCPPLAPSSQLCCARDQGKSLRDRPGILSSLKVHWASTCARPPVPSTGRACSLGKASLHSMQVMAKGGRAGLRASIWAAVLSRGWAMSRGPGRQPCGGILMHGPGHCPQTSKTTCSSLGFFCSWDPSLFFCHGRVSPVYIPPGVPAHMSAYDMGVFLVLGGGWGLCS